LALRLLNAGEKVTIIAREASKVKHLTDLGATLVQGDQSNGDVVDKAFKGAKSVFWLIPPINGPTYTKWALDQVTQAAEKAKLHGITRIIYLSAIGAQFGTGSGVIEFHGDAERIFQRSVPNVASLRPGFFFENFLRDLSGAAQGTVYAAYQEKTRYPFVATSDISDAAFRYLVSDDWKGHHTVGVHGPKDYTFTEAWAVLAKAVGKDIKVVSVPPEAATAGMKQANLPDFVVKGFSDFLDAWYTKLYVAEPRTPNTTTPTTLHEWAVKVFKPALAAQK
jgi:uncharacterized protein YbjT (DUF2867 family)